MVEFVGECFLELDKNIRFRCGLRAERVRSKLIG